MSPVPNAGATRLGTALAGKGKPQLGPGPASMRTGVVSNVGSTTASLTIGGVTIPNVPWVGGTPVEGPNVVLVQPPNMVIIGSTGTGKFLLTAAKVAPPVPNLGDMWVDLSSPGGPSTPPSSDPPGTTLMVVATNETPTYTPGTGDRWVVVESD